MIVYRYLRNIHSLHFTSKRGMDRAAHFKAQVKVGERKGRPVYNHNTAEEKFKRTTYHRKEQDEHWKWIQFKGPFYISLGFHPSIRAYMHKNYAYKNFKSYMHKI